MSELRSGGSRVVLTGKQWEILLDGGDFLFSTNSWVEIYQKKMVWVERLDESPFLVNISICIAGALLNYLTFDCDTNN